MKKILLKAAVYILVFISSVLVFGHIFSRRQTNITVDMDPASQPVIYMSIGDITYNPLFGYSSQRDISYDRDTLTYMDEGRRVSLVINSFGEKVSAASYELRNIEDNRLIEEGVAELFLNNIGNMTAKIGLKDLYKTGAEYSMAIKLNMEDGRDIYYYTRVIAGDSELAYNKIAYAKFFHEALFDRKTADAIKKHLETNSSLSDNSTFAHVDIHSSFSQVTYGELEVIPYGDPLITLHEDCGPNATICIDYMLRSGYGMDMTAYKAHEAITVRYTDKGVYIMAYDRTMEEIADPTDMCVNDKIILGIADEHPEMMESEEGGCVAFVSGGRLFEYNEGSGKLASVYSFYDYGVFDVRNINSKHDIRILRVEDNGDMVFAVYGYMNRGDHEGDIGICVYEYEDSINSIKEVLYIPYEKSPDILLEEAGRLLYMNDNSHLYFTMENSVFRIDLGEKTIRTTGMYWSGDVIQTSEDQRYIVTITEDTGELSRDLAVTDLNNETSVIVSAGTGEYIRFLGFIGEDMIYGVARQEDLQTETSGNLLFPMYRICICDGTGKLLTYYEKEGYYVTEAEVKGNMIFLSRLTGTTGSYAPALEDTITSMSEDQTGRNYLSVAVIDKYERYVQIQTRNSIKVNNLKVTTPGEIMTEEVAVLNPDLSEDLRRFYVFDARGGCRIYLSESAAVKNAYECGGTAIEENGNVIWKYSSRKTVNQIMDIVATETAEGETPLSVCMDVMMSHEGILRNSELLLGGGSSISDILQENMDKVTVLDLTGCTLDQLFYYLDRDIPVMALMQGGGAVLITGHNEKELVILDPASGELYKKDISKMEDVFENNGNQFITYAYAGSEIWADKM
ncbi:MAG: hypothetical protein J5476_03660 [Lachnospiraceae bacterium]|nr:hypothetical protein [Lachnospiraceae bacterium]